MYQIVEIKYLHPAPGFEGSLKPHRPTYRPLEMRCGNEITGTKMKNKSPLRIVPALFCALPLLFVTGCAWSIGDGKDTHIKQTTKGQELIDLKKAHDEGAITDEEYQNQRTKVLNR